MYSYEVTSPFDAFPTRRDLILEGLEASLQRRFLIWQRADVKKSGPENSAKFRDPGSCTRYGSQNVFTGSVAAILLDENSSLYLPLVISSLTCWWTPSLLK